MQIRRFLPAALAVLLIGALALYLLTMDEKAKEASGGSVLPHAVEVKVPELKGDALTGQTVFAGECAVCHGANASGGPGGPPLIHKIYEPSHHGDGAFVMAVRRGVRQHHWQFGNMPPVNGVSDADLRALITYLRTLQVANGIE